MDKGFLDIFYDPKYDGVFSRNIDNAITGINTSNSLYAKGYYLNAHAVGGFGVYNGNNIRFDKGTFCGVESGEGLAKLQPGCFPAFGKPFLTTTDHSPTKPTMDGLVLDPEDIVLLTPFDSGKANSFYTSAYPANTPLFNNETGGALRGIDTNGDGYGYFPFNNGLFGLGDVTGDGVINEDDCISNAIDSGVEAPRAYKIGKRVFIVSEHFRPHYRKFGRCSNNQCNNLLTDAAKIRFMNVDGSIFETEILAGHFCGDRYTVDPAEAGMPDLAEGSWESVLGGDAETLYESREWYDTIAQPRNINALPRMDYCVYITADEIPDTVPTFRPITKSFMDKYMNETLNPSTAQSVRNAISIDQYGRMIMSSVHAVYNETIDTYSWNNSVSKTSLKSFTTGDETLDEIAEQVTYKVGTSAYFARYKSYVDTLIDKKYIVTSDVPQITETHHFDYDFRDYGAIEYGSHSHNSGNDRDLYGTRGGDSSSCLIFPFEDVNGNKFFGYWGQQLNPSLPAQFGGVHDEFFVDSLNYICDKYQIDRVEWLDDTVDISPSTTPQDIRPTLGYKVYKSSVGKDGPYFDITDQVVPYNRTALTSQVVGIPCIDPDVPCYTIHENFIDEFVTEGDEIYYYVTRIEDNGVGGYYESDPSEVIKITVPSGTNQWSDSEERYLSRDNANNGVLVGTPAINDEALNIPTSRTVRHLFDGYRMESGVNVPMLGYRSGLPNALGLGQVIGTDPSDREFYYRIDNTAGDNDGTIESIVPLDNTSYQYILGTPSSSGELNYQFKLFVPSSSTAIAQWSQAFGKDIVLTKYDPVKNVNEAYMHSRIYPSAFGYIANLYINPRGYGHKSDGESDWDLYFFDERTSNPDSITGFKMGDYFSQDLKLINSATSGGNFNLYASGNASDTSYATGSLLDWIDMSGYTNPLGDFDVSNNGLYALKTRDSTGQPGDNYGVTSFAKRINISNNKIFSLEGDLPLWRTDTSFGQSPDEWTDILITVTNPTTYINANNAGYFALEIPNKNQNVVEYVDMSKTLITATGSSNGAEYGRKLIRSKTIQNLYLDDMKESPIGYGPSVLPLLNFQACGYLENISAKIDSNATYANGAEGYGLIYFNYDPEVDDGSSQCGWANLRFLDLSCNGEAKHRIRSINLGYSHDDVAGWNGRYNPLPPFDTNDISSFEPFADKEFESPHFHGNLAPNLEYVNVSGMTSLVRLHLPKVSSEHDLNCTNVPSNRTYLNYINVSNTQLGIDESLEDFLRDAIEGYRIGTPAGYTITVVAENVKDQNGVIVRTPESVINSIKTAFSNQGKTFEFIGETSVG